MPNIPSRSDQMKMTEVLVAILFATGIGGCAGVDRSRNLNDARVPAKVIAQQVCSNCHGLDGNSTSPNFPNLAGQTELYTAEQLRSFRKHSRSDPAGFEYMWGLSRHLTDEQINGLASYYAAQTPIQQSPEGLAVQVASGKVIFDTGVSEKNIPACRTCHGDQGQGNGAFPRLADQHADYLIKQLKVFQRTEERPEGALMKVIAHDMTEANIQDVAAFLQTIPNPVAHSH